MDVVEILYSIGEGVERIWSRVVRAVKSFFAPEPSQTPPKPILSRLTQKNLTPNEFFSLHVQLCFIVYLTANFVVELFIRGTSALAVLVGMFVVHVLYLRYYFGRYSNYTLNPEPYRVFYFGVSAVAFIAFLGYSLMRILVANPYYYYAYVALVAVGVLLFRWYYKRRFGRDYAYGVVEEVKGDIMRVFVHDDICANVKPGRYWVPAVPDAEPGCVVKVLVEERFLRGAVPVRVLEVYLGQSSQMKTEPKDEIERRMSM